MIRQALRRTAVYLALSLTAVGALIPAALLSRDPFSVEVSRLMKLFTPKKACLVHQQSTF